jgi:predicted molibdopterin-dependent oxidoreductase YjgC
MVHQAIPSQGNSRPDWQVIVELSRRIQQNEVDGEYSVWDYQDTAQIMTEIAALTPAYAGVSHERLEHVHFLHWPVKNYSHPGTPILSMEHFAGGRGRFTLMDDTITKSRSRTL